MFWLRNKKIIFFVTLSLTKGLDKHFTNICFLSKHGKEREVFKILAYLPYALLVLSYQGLIYREISTSRQYKR